MCWAPIWWTRWDTVIVFETALEPRLYVARSEARTDLLHRTNTATYCNYKRFATCWASTIGDTVVEDIAWSYEDPLPETTPIKGLLSFDPSRVDMIAELPDSPGAPDDCGCSA